MIEVASHPDGCVLPVRAKPGSRRPAILEEHAGSLRVAVSEAPERGRANAAIVECLAHALGLRRADVRLISGVTSRDKRFLLRGLTPREAIERLRPPPAVEPSSTSPGI